MLLLLVIVLQLFLVFSGADLWLWLRMMLDRRWEHVLFVVLV